jgi:hypothetical protein
MNKLTAIALLMAFVAVWSYSAGKHSAKSVPQPQSAPVKKAYKTVVDVQPLPNIPTRFGKDSTAQERKEHYFYEGVRKAINGNR